MSKVLVTGEGEERRKMHISRHFSNPEFKTFNCIALIFLKQTISPVLHILDKNQVGGERVRKTEKWGMHPK